MFGKAFDEVSITDLQALVNARIPEGRCLDFKRDLYERTDDAKREVSAMANALGGYLLIGIEEENGIASGGVDVDAGNPNALVRGIAKSIRASIEPPILGVRVR